MSILFLFSNTAIFFNFLLSFWIIDSDIEWWKIIIFFLNNFGICTRENKIINEIFMWALTKFRLDYSNNNIKPNKSQKLTWNQTKIFLSLNPFCRNAKLPPFTITIYIFFSLSLVSFALMSIRLLFHIYILMYFIKKLLIYCIG